jgi:23S rRNA pseudouridine1911/1915/1917 synthase
MLHIYYYDRDLAICEKPRGTLSEGSGKDALPSLLASALSTQGDTQIVYPVHRLDRETEGIMVFARNTKTAAALSAQMAAHEVHKEYVAEVHGTPSPTEGRMEDLLFFDRTRNRSYVVLRTRRGVKDAALRYRVLETSEDGISRVAIRLETGRTHQIRVQFSSRKMPLVGDRRYGAPQSGRPLALRACYLSFIHPTTGERLAFGESHFEESDSV